MKKTLIFCILAGLWGSTPSLMAQGRGNTEDEATTETDGTGKGKKNNAGAGKGDGANKKGAQEQPKQAPRNQAPDRPPENSKPQKKADAPTANTDRPKNSDGQNKRNDSPNKAAQSNDDRPKNRDQGGNNEDKRNDNPGLSDGGQGKKNQGDNRNNADKERNVKIDEDNRKNADKERNVKIDEDNRKNIDKERNVKIDEDNRKNIDKERNVKIDDDNRKNVDKERNVKIDEDNRKNIDKERNVKIDEDNRKNVDKERNVKIDEDNRKNIDKERNVRIDEDNRKNVDKERNVRIDEDNRNVDKSRTNKTEITNINIDRRPGKGDRPPRVERKREWVEVREKNNNHWNNWRSQNEVKVVKFKQEREVRWKNVARYKNNDGWARRYGDNEYKVWRKDVWDYRRDRAVEIWDRRQDRWDDVFDDHWWAHASWRGAPRTYVSVSPWWWRQPVAWSSVNVFFGDTVAAQPIVYDPGTTVIYEGDTYYVNGESRGRAVEARQAARALAYPKVAVIPIPEPAEEGERQEWQPLGAWVLTQQEAGDATMFMQLSVNRDGIVAGAYKNVLTGDEQPILGQLDKDSQRLAWHVGEATETVYETGLANLAGDVASVFVHFGEDETQTWLLVRLPSPEMPPTTVSIPEYLAQN